MGLFDGFARAKGRTFEVEDVLCGDHYVMVLVHVTRQKGMPSDTRYVHVMRTKNGRVTESWHFDEDQARLDDLLSGES
jgi:ketosteroid isomerase-like protein